MRTNYAARPSKHALSMSRAANPGGEAPGIHDGKPETAGRHGVSLRILFLVKGDLHAGNARHAAHPREQSRGRMTILWTMRPEQYHAISVALLPIGESPFLLGIEAHPANPHRRGQATDRSCAGAPRSSGLRSRVTILQTTSSFHRTLSYLIRYTLVFPPTRLKFTLNPFQIHSDRATPTLHVTRISPRTSSWLQDRSQSLLKYPSAAPA